MQIGIISFWLVLAVLSALVVFRGRTKALPAAEKPAELPPGSDDADGERAVSVGAKTADTQTPARVKAEEAPKGRALADGLSETKTKGFIARLDRLLRGRPKVDDDLLDQIEEVLFTADIGAKTAQKLLAAVTHRLDRDEIADPDAVWQAIRESAHEILAIDAAPLDYEVEPRPYVLLAIGVNGVGKTTTLAKFAASHTAAGRRVLLVAGDTFRAAAADQLGVWAERIGCDIHQGRDGADPSSVIFDGISRARREGHDIVLCDTAGRLHTRDELMQELSKICRSAEKALSSEGQTIHPHDVFLVLDATIGQNALAQAKLFKQTVDFTGLVMTKLDGTAKGGVVLGVCDEMQIPVRFIGIGEQMNDLKPFDPGAFADILFTPDDTDAKRVRATDSVAS